MLPVNGNLWQSVILMKLGEMWEKCETARKSLRWIDNNGWDAITNYDIHMARTVLATPRHCPVIYSDFFFLSFKTNEYLALYGQEINDEIARSQNQTSSVTLQPGRPAKVLISKTN